MWVLIYWILIADGHGGYMAPATGHVEFSSFAACERARRALPSEIRSTCVEHD
jgi:hypothetical protein